MPLGIILLLVVGFLIFLGYAQRVLDYLYLTDRGAIIVILLIIAGSFVDIPISQSPPVSINIGGAIIPLALVVYILIRADSKEEKRRGILAGLITGVVIYTTAWLLRGFGHGPGDILDPSYLFAILAGIVAYALGRSRRGAFVAAIIGFIFYETIVLVVMLRRGVPTAVNYGGAGLMDTTLIAAFLALGFNEIIGEIAEKVATKVRGRKSDHDQNE